MNKQETTNTVYVLRGDIQDLWEYYVYGAFANIDEAVKAAQKLYDNSNTECREEMEHDTSL